jgi:hypothetical protein
MNRLAFNVLSDGRLRAHRAFLCAFALVLVMSLSLPLMAFGAPTSDDADETGATDSAPAATEKGAPADEEDMLVAEEDVFLAGEEDVTGNWFASDPLPAGLNVATDLYWIGSELEAEDVQVGTDGGGSALIAGSDIAWVSSSVNGSLRIAAQDIAVHNSQVTNNMTIAGQRVTIDGGSSARGVYVAAETVQLQGEFGAASLAANKVSIDSTFEGDLFIAAQYIDLSSDTVVAGTLTVPENAQLNIAEGAQVGEVQRYVSPTPSEAEQQDEFRMFLFVLGFAICAHIVLALVFLSLGHRLWERLLAELVEAPGKTLLTGLGTFVLCPVVFVVLCVLVVTLPLAFLLGVSMLMLWAFAIPTTAVVLALLLSDAKLGGKYQRSLSAGFALVLTVFTYLPNMFTLVPTLCTIFLAGCLMRLMLRARAEEKLHPYEGYVGPNSEKIAARRS